MAVGGLATRSVPMALPGGRCLGCDYLLHELPDARCPECGRAFDRNDISTVNTGPPLGRFGRWALRPIGWPTYAAALAPFLLVFWAATDPQVYYMVAVYFLCAFALVPAVVVGVARSIARTLVMSRMTPPRPVPAIDRGQWRLLGGMVAAAVLLVAFKVPMLLAFLASRAQLERIALQARANRAAPWPANARAGLYDVLEATDYGTDRAPIVLIQTSPGGGGFRYSPEGPAYFGFNPGDEGHLWGPWYWYSSD